MDLGLLELLWIFGGIVVGAIICPALHLGPAVYYLWFAAASCALVGVVQAANGNAASGAFPLVLALVFAGFAGKWTADWAEERRRAKEAKQALREEMEAKNQK